MRRSCRGAPLRDQLPVLLAVPADGVVAPGLNVLPDDELVPPPTVNVLPDEVVPDDEVLPDGEVPPAALVVPPGVNVDPPAP